MVLELSASVPAGWHSKGVTPGSSKVASRAGNGQNAMLSPKGHKSLRKMDHQ